MYCTIYSPCCFLRKYKLCDMRSLTKCSSLSKWACGCTHHLPNPDVRVNNMSADDYYPRHLQGSCCDWLSPFCLSSASAIPLLHTESHTQTGSWISISVESVNHVLEDFPTFRVAHKWDENRDRQRKYERVTARSISYWFDQDFFNTR